MNMLTLIPYADKVDIFLRKVSARFHIHRIHAYVYMGVIWVVSEHLNLNKLLVTRQMTLFLQGVRSGWGGISP